MQAGDRHKETRHAGENQTVSALDTLARTVNRDHRNGQWVAQMVDKQALVATSLVVAGNRNLAVVAGTWAEAPRTLVA